MDKSIKKFMGTPTRSKARILNDRQVEVLTPDGEVFTVFSDMAKYNSDDYKAYELHLIEFIFDRNFSEDKEQMVHRILQEFIYYAVPSMGLDSGNRQAERVRIGKRIKELREAKKMDARDLALLTGIDAANLSRIEQGKYSTGIDILSRIAVILNAHLDLIPNEESK
jgi:DNA-binding Xre family transcriptional regulator